MPDLECNIKYEPYLGGLEENMGFRQNFVWGAATASYQIEGGHGEDGKGRDIWDVFSEQPGRIFGGHDGKIACDHYHRMEEDVKLMAKMGLKAYRFSISWTRILPRGTGEVNPKGIEFYNRLIDTLLSYGIEPYITLFHWDYPYELSQRGGWQNEDSVKWFEHYAKIIAENYSDRVSHFFTLNEPQIFIGLGYVKGNFAPGYQAGAREFLQMSHNVLKAHGSAVKALRTYGKQPLKIGFAPCGSMNYPESEKEEDIRAARESIFAVPDTLEELALSVSWWSDPVFLGAYPKEALEKYKVYLPVITPEDMELIHQPLDFMGQNVYNGKMVRCGIDREFEFSPMKPGYAKTGFNWPVTPECLYWGMKFLYERYQKPIYITENGLSCPDVVSLDGQVHDANRIDFLNRYLLELKRGAETQADIAGYFLWSFMDNFEWANGYSERFGMIYVDYETQKRIPKDSAYWYKETIEQNGENL